MDCIYNGLEPKNRRTVEHHFEGRIMSKPYQVVATLLDIMVVTTEKSQKKYDWDTLVTQVEVLSNQVEGLEEQEIEKDQNFALREWTKGKGQGVGLSNDPLWSI